MLFDFMGSSMIFAAITCMESINQAKTRKMESDSMLAESKRQAEIADLKFRLLGGTL
jgi:hypothetical protein